MIRSGSIWIVATALSLAGLEVPAAAQETSEARIQELIRQSAERVATGQPVATAQAPAIQAAATSDARPTVRLTLDDAVKLALDRNLDIAVQRLNPQINDIAIASIRSIYHPSLTSTVLTQSQTTPATNTLGGANVAGAGVVNDTANYNAGVAQSIPWGGGSVAVQFNNSRATTTSLNNLYNPCVRLILDRAVHAAAASRIPDGQHTAATRSHQHQPGHFRRPASRVNHQYAVECSERLLGLRHGRSGSRSGTAVARSGGEPGA